MTRHVVPLVHHYGDTIDRLLESYTRRSVLVRNFNTATETCADMAELLNGSDLLRDEEDGATTFITWLTEHCKSAKLFLRLGLTIEHLHLEIYDDTEFFDYQLRWQKPKK